MREPLNVLLSAYACRPGQGSEPGVGWNITHNVAQEHNVWVFTYARHRDAIERELAERPISTLRVLYYDLPFPLSLLNRNWKGLGLQVHYYLWQLGIYIAARRLAREVRFDVVQHITYVRYWQPSFLALLPIPFIWGPVGGGESAPAPFMRDFGWRGKAFEVLRDIARRVGEGDPFVRMTTRRSVVSLATTEHTAARLRALGARRVELVGESGLSEQDIAHLADFAAPPADVPTRFISMARLLHWKGLHLGLRAFAQADLPGAEYWILGDGPERERLEALALELGVADRVRFWGLLPRAESLHKLGSCHVLIHPSLHDSGGWVCLEAMAAGRPVVCLDLGGPALQVTPATGIKVSVQTPEVTVRDLAAAMTRLAGDPTLRHRLGEAGRAHVTQSYRWRSKAEYYSQLYREDCRPST